MQTFDKKAILTLVFAGVALPASVHAQLSIPQMTMIDGMRNADIMNRTLKNAEQRAKAAAANRGAAKYSGNWGLPAPAAPLRMLAVGQLGIRFPANCGVVPPSEGFRLPVITSNQTMWGGIQCADGTWVQSWMRVLEPTDSPVSLEALADRELASWGDGLFETNSGELGPQSITRTYNSDPRGVCRGSVNVENDGRYYTFVLCYPNTQQALWTKDVITSNLSKLAPEWSAAR